ncbi:MAG: hypothetical protein AAB257_06075, partial [Nitrospinota bacterium]
LNGPARIVVDINNVYWTEYAGGSENAGAVKKLPINGGDVTILVSGLNAPRGIAMDGNYIYITESGTSSNEGTIKKIPKNE